MENKRMKKCKSIGILVDNLAIGGLQRVVTIIGEQLAKNNNLYYFILNPKESLTFYPIIKSKALYIREPPLMKAQAYAFIIYLKIKTKLSPESNIFNLSARYKRLKKALMQEQIDTLIIAENSFLMTDRLKKDFPNLKIIIWCHNTFDVYFNNYYKSYQPRFIQAMKIADKIVVLTESDRQSYGKFSNKVICITNPLTLDNNGKVANLDEKIISISCRYKIKHKGLDYLAQIAKELPDDWRIAIAGTGTKNEINELIKLIDEAGVKNKFLLRGPISGTELLNHYQDSSIYVMTSRWEGFGLVLTEAMNFGLPIISFENSGPNEILRNGKDGILIKQGDIEDFSKQLIRLINSKKLREEYSIKSLERVKDFKFDNITEKWEDIL
jgi:glycosyltransferase involved in cell wall biosynthesis